MKILILGATGSIGTHLVEQSLMLGHSVRALVRDPAKLQFKHYALEPMQGDALVAEDVEKATESQDAVIYALGVGKCPHFFSQTTSLLLCAMQKHQVRRLIAITGIGTGDSRGHGGWIYERVILSLFTKSIYEDKDVQENLIRESDLDWTIVRPASFNNGPLGGRLRATDQLEGVTISGISRADAAAFVLHQLKSAEWLKKSPSVGY